MAILLAAGLLLGLPTRPHYVFAGPLGLYAGQLAYAELFYYPRGPIILPVFIGLAHFAHRAFKERASRTI
jgi:hypothetical protein